MPRSTGRGPSAAMQAAHLYLSNRDTKTIASGAMGDKAGGPYRVIADYCLSHGTEDDKGSFTWRFQEPIITSAGKCPGFVLQARQPASQFDEDRARELIDSLGDKAAGAKRTVTVYDYDWLFLALQQGWVTGEQVSGVLVIPEREYSLRVLQEH